ncbi:hypothetical protein BH10PSE7_BH10PSE7_01440 [soil metagenome]
MTHEIAAQRVPGRWDMALFQAKAAVFRARRFALELFASAAPRKYGRGNALEGGAIIAQTVSPLAHTLTGNRDQALTAGKIQNLRIAVRAIDGIEIPAGGIFSFWRQIGRCTRARGFVKGRELREGCIIANVCVGLCQLSNVLYEAALDAGFEIVERHAHSLIVPGSRAASGRDATVFWNYVDLRFRSPHAFRIEVSLKRGNLRVVFRSFGGAPQSISAQVRGSGAVANDCTTCNQVTCARHDPEQPLGTKLPAAWLVDACWPEFAALFAEQAGKGDALFLPQRLKQTDRHAWPRGRAGAEHRATIVALRRAIALRRAPKQGRALQSLLLRYERALAESYARRLSHLHTHVMVSQPLLPHLWQLGVLAGRSFDVLLERHPIDVLQAKLDEAKAAYPESPTLGDFRAPADIAAAEREALAEARCFYTPHRALAAALDPARTVLLDWHKPQASPVKRGGKTILFPASALGRKGAHALREALQGFDVELAITGRAREQDGDFWSGIKVRNIAGQPWPLEIAAAVLPAVIEHQPRALLKALASGIPVIATEACGLGPMDGVETVPAYDAVALRSAIERALG